ncbi:MAG TPA: hypothetical protein VL173_16740 [Vicinamibacterales bacterium]|nr:hypothetical protein [Vicinamibacterales bacterium]
MRLRQVYVAGGVLFAMALARPLSLVSAVPNAACGESTRRTIRLTLRDGSSRLARLDGVGCNASICSRAIINTRSIGVAGVTHTRLDEVAAVRDIEPASALLVLKDGSTHRVSVVPENRVFYVIGADGREEKLELGKLTSIEFEARASR